MQRYFAQALELKRASVALARVSEAGVFEGYASVFGVVDTANDEVMRGAFTDTLQRRGPRGVKMLWQHQPFEPIGTWLSIAEDARGLKVVGRLDLAVARAREALALMRSGAVDGLSIGFRTERAATDQKSGVRRLQRIDLWEISIVTFPALPQARIGALEQVSPKFRPPPERPPATLADLRVKLSRLRMRTAALSFEVKLRRFSHSLETRYSPNQPRVPAGSPEVGQWTSGGGGSDIVQDYSPSNDLPGQIAQNDAADAGDGTLSQSPLAPLHPDSTYESDAKAKRSLQYRRQQPTDRIVESLKPGQEEALTVKPDGTIMNGNTRVKILGERGYDVHSLPRQPYRSHSLGGRGGGGGGGGLFDLWRNRNSPRNM